MDILYKKEFYIPFFIVLLFNLEPDIYQTSTAIILKEKENWDNINFALLSLISCILVFPSVFFFLKGNLSKKLNIQWILFFGILINTIGLSGYYSLAFIEKFQKDSVFFIMQLWPNILVLLSETTIVSFFFQIFNECCPKGFENTGITLVLAIYNSGVLLGDIFGLGLMNIFKIKAKNFKRFIYPLMITQSYGVLLLILIMIINLIK